MDHTQLDPLEESRRILPGPLAEKAAAFLSNEYAWNTLKAYRSDFRHFSAFCQKTGSQPLPATPQTVFAYLSFYGDALKVSVLSRRLSAIKKVHTSQGHESPTNDVKVRRLFKSIRRTQGIAQKQARPSLKQDVAQALSAIPEDNLRGLRDKCLMLTGFVGAFRRSELAALNVEDLIFDDRGITVHVVSSKTDQEKAGDFKILPFAPDPMLCPVRTMKKWLETSGIAAGPVFRAIDRQGRPGSDNLSDKAVYRTVKQYFGDQYSPHSLRAGFVTQAKKNGAGDYEIMRQTKHRTRTMIDRYTRIDSAWENNAALKI